MNHNCDEALASLYLYLDSELDGANTAGIRSHLEKCTDCFGTFDFEQRLRQVVHDRLQENVPEHLLDRIKAAIDDHPSSLSGGLA